MGVMSKIGQTAPAFSLPDQQGKIHNLADYNGKWVVLYFYPKDDTPGCTKQACDFRDHKGHLEQMGAAVVGVSADEVESHDKFHDKYGLNFPLLADPERKTIEAYGAWGQKNVFGKIIQGILRQTFLIDPQGKIAKVWEKVDVENHVAEVEAALNELRLKA